MSAIQLLVNACRYFQKKKAEFKIQKYNKNIHSQEGREGYKGYRMAEGVSPTPSVILTGLVKSCLNHRKMCPSLMPFLKKN